MRWGPEGGGWAVLKTTQVWFLSLQELALYNMKEMMEELCLQYNITPVDPVKNFK